MFSKNDMHLWPVSELLETRKVLSFAYFARSTLHQMCNEARGSGSQTNFITNQIT